MLIVVTGATGLVGSRVCQQLLAAGHHVRGLKHQSEPRFDGHHQVNWFQGSLDACDPVRLLQDCDGLVHAALSRDEASFMAEPSDTVAYYQTNVIGSLRLFNAAVKVGVGRCVSISSGAVHEKTIGGDQPIDETHPLWPASIYGAVKAAVETQVHAYGLSGKLQIASLRPTTIFGVADPVQNSRYYQLVENAAAGRVVDISGGGKVVAAEDVATAAIHLVTGKFDIAGQTYNCVDRFVSNAEVVAMIESVAGRTFETTGEVKKAGRSMSHQKLAATGFRFDTATRLRRTIAALWSAVGDAATL